jgi:hypothetical protein
MIRLSRPTASKTASSLSTTNAGSFDLEYNYLSSPPLAHAKEGSTTYISFHLPPPPPSPTMGNKQQMERKMYRGQQCSPASPSPSTRSILSPPPITVRLGAPRKESDNQLPGGLESDSNNIQYASPLNPFMTPTGLLWNDPKLSPIHGSIIACSPNLNGGLSTPKQVTSTRGASLTSTLSRHFSKAPLSLSQGSSRPGSQDRNAE